MILQRPAIFAFAAVLFVSPAIAFASEPGEGGTAGGKTAEAADPFDAEHIFGFVDGSDIGEKGEQEIESVTVGRVGRIGTYANAANETSYRNTVASFLRLSVGTLTDYDHIVNVPGYDNRSAATFSGVTAEVRFNILNRAESAVGLSLSFNPEWRQFDPDSGARAVNTAIPISLLMDKEMIPGKLFLGSSLAYAPSFIRVASNWEHDDNITATAAASYALTPVLFAAAEIRHENTAADGNMIAHALYLGPSIFYKVLPNLSIKVAWAAQIPDAGARTLDLTTYDRNQFELHLSYNF